MFFYCIGIAIGIIIVDNILVEYILLVVDDDDDYYIVTDYFLVEYILVESSRRSRDLEIYSRTGRDPVVTENQNFCI